jgi:hypothetical protein
MEVEDRRLDLLFPAPNDPLYEDNRFHFAFLTAKVLHFAKHYGRSACPSWTLAKEVPDGTLQEMIDIIDKAPEIHAPLVITAVIGTHTPCRGAISYTERLESEVQSVFTDATPLTLTVCELS